MSPGAKERWDAFIFMEINSIHSLSKYGSRIIAARYRRNINPLNVFRLSTTLCIDLYVITILHVILLFQPP